MIKASWFFHISFQIIFSSTINIQRNGSIKSLPCSGLLLALYELMKWGGTCKMNIEMALKSRSYIFDLDHVKLSLGILFFLSRLIENIVYQLLGSTFIFVKNTHQKASNLMCCLISPVAKSAAWFPEVQYRFPYWPS